MAGEPPAASLGLEWFRGRLGTIFDVQTASGAVPLQVVEAAARPSSGGFERYSVLFQGPVDRALAQGTYEFRAASGQPFHLFIVPIVGSNAERLVYEAVFSRPLAP